MTPHPAAVPQKPITPESLLTVVVPVYNEERQLTEVIDWLMRSPCPMKREWIFVDDCSTDGSLSILRRMQGKYGFRLIEQSPNQGKGAAVIRGIAEAQGDLILIQDADFEYDPSDIPSLLEPFFEGRADVVYGSRFRQGAHRVHRTYHYFVNRLLTLLSNLMSGIYLSDMETCYKVFRRELVQGMNLISKRFGIEVEFTANIAKTRARIFELPISYYPRTRLQGKKIGWKDGVAALWHLVRFNWLRGFETAFRPGIPVQYVPLDLLDSRSLAIEIQRDRSEHA
jgi:glycosyltransferase involved in cell wall biosynthesis